MMRARPFLTTLSHPASISAIALLILNDHVLKSAWPSWTTGKLSDVAGLVFFPLLLAALVELLLPLRHVTPRQVMATCIATTAVVFTSVELIPLAANTYSVTMGALQWPLRFALDSTAQLLPVVTTPDPSDLLTLPVLVISWRVATATIKQDIAKPDQPNPPPPADRAHRKLAKPNFSIISRTR